MGKGTKVAIKIKGTAHGVKKALASITGQSDSAPPQPIRLREADFRSQSKKNKVT